MFLNLITCVTNKGLDQLGFTLHALFRFLNKGLDFFKLVTGRISQFRNLQVAPYPRGWVEFGRVRRQEYGADMAMTSEERVDGARSVSLQAIPDEYKRGLKLAVELGEELDSACRVDIGIAMEAEIEVHSIPFGRHAQRTDDRYLLVRTRTLVEDRGMASRRPATSHQRRHQQA